MTTRTRTSSALLAAATLGAALLPFLGATPASAAATPTAVTKKYIVRFAASTTTSEKERTISNRKGKVKRHLSHVFNGSIVELTAAEAKILKSGAGILSVEEDIAMRAIDTQNPTPSWGLDRIDQTNLPLNSTYSWGTSGVGVTAYIVDTGINLTHVQFTNRVRAGYDVWSQGAVDCNGHGTHVAGTVGGSTYGVARDVSLVAVRVLDCAGSGTTSGVIAGIDWAIGDHVSGPAVMNMSLGGGKSLTLEAAVDRAFADGITVAVAAGNSNVDACTSSPAGNVASAITVGATTSLDARASYSNWGTCLDVFAPGTSIVSAYTGSTTASAQLSGTSMASPHVAGIAARYLQANPSATPADVASAIVANAVSGVVTGAGTGSPNKLAFVSANDLPVPTTTTIPVTTTTAAPVTTTTIPVTTTTVAPVRNKPGKPTRPKAVAGKASATITWTDSTDGGAAITSHVVRVYRKHWLFGNQLVKELTANSSTTQTIVGLGYGNEYVFSVAAVNEVGTGEFSLLSNKIEAQKNESNGKNKKDDDKEDDRKSSVKKSSLKKTSLKK